MTTDVTAPPRFLDEHLNVNWLRPESALWDTIASEVVSQFPFRRPSLDLGSGNGIFSFITAGGAFSAAYDWYRNVDPNGFWENRDIYDTFLTQPRQEWMVRQTDYQIDCGLDAKRNLLRQAEALELYGAVVTADANHRLPFDDESFETVFSNILYWLQAPEPPLRDIRRVLRPGGRALLCLQDHKFREYCTSYRWKELGSEALRLVNRGRGESHRWTISYDELVTLASAIGFKVVAHTYYLSPLTLKVWDIGLRWLSPLLIRMSHKLNDADRLDIKAEWIHSVRPFLQELSELDRRSHERGGFHFICLERV